MKKQPEEEKPICGTPFLNNDSIVFEEGKGEIIRQGEPVKPSDEPIEYLKPPYWLEEKPKRKLNWWWRRVK